jgi:hypothetical protein
MSEQEIDDVLSKSLQESQLNHTQEEEECRRGA